MPTDPLAQRLRLAIVLGLLLLVGLTALNLLQAASGLRKDNARSLSHARAMIESAINDSQSLVEAARPLAMGRCQDEQLALRDLITASPYARALYVLEGQQLRCSTLHRPILTRDIPRGPAGNQTLTLARHSPITGQTAILYRQPSGDRTLLVELDGFHIFGALQAVMGEDNLFFLLGDQALDGHGRTLPAARLLEGGQRLQQSEPTAHPYRLVALNGYKEVLAFAWAYNQENLLAAPVLALLLGLLTFYLASSQRLPPQRARQSHGGPGVHPLSATRDG